MILNNDSKQIFRSFIKIETKHRPETKYACLYVLRAGALAYEKK